MKIDGFKSALEALGRLDSNDQERILTEIAKKDPNMAERLKEGLFTFEDLSQTNSSGLQKLISLTEESTWSIALRGASSNLLNKIQSCLSQRHFERIENSIEEIGPQRKSKIAESREEIMIKARELKEQGSLFVKKDSHDPLV